MPPLLAFLLVYLLPGFAIAAIFSDRTRWNPIVWVMMSLIVTPVALANLGFLGLRATSSRGGVVLVSLLSVFLWSAAMLARNRGLALAMKPREGEPPARLVRGLALLTVLLFTVAVAATRISLTTGHSPGLADDLQRLSQVTAVAVTGVPPRHYDFPEIPLSYYYYDFVIAGLAVRLSEPHLSSATALFLHVAIQTLTFGLGIYWIAFRLCRSQWTSLFLILLLSFAAGPGFWELPARVLGAVGPWLSRALPGPLPFEISLPATLAVWVPHHWVAGNAVLLTIAIICYLEGSKTTRAVLLAIVFAFVAGCSVFVGLALAPALVLWLALAWRQRWSSWDARSILLALGVAALLSASLLDTYLWRTPLVGLDLPTDLAPGADLGGASFLGGKLASLPAFLLRLAIEGGGALVFFLVWLGLDRHRLRRDPMRAWIAAVGLAFIPFAYLFRSPIFNDFGTRGVVPLEFAWAVGAALALESPARREIRTLLAAVAIVGTLSALPSAARGIHQDLQWDSNAAPAPAFVTWINSTAPLDAPVLLANPLLLGRDPMQHVIERARLVDLATMVKMDAFHGQYFQRPRLTALNPPPVWELRSVEGACRTGRRLRPDVQRIYIVDQASGPSSRVFGPAAFQSETYNVYQVDCPPAARE